MYFATQPRQNASALLGYISTTVTLGYIKTPVTVCRYLSCLDTANIRPLSAITYLHSNCCSLAHHKTCQLMHAAGLIGIQLSEEQYGNALP